MLNKVDANRQTDSKEYKSEMKTLEKQMTALQESIQQLQIPTVIVFEGWGASGKGTQIARVVYPWDPRFFNVYTMDKVTEDMRMRPFLWPYWTRTPARGRISIYDKSWHRIMLPDRTGKWKTAVSGSPDLLYDINAFEKQLTDDGVLIVKLFLHISKDEQKNRLKELEKNSETAWRVDEKDWEQNKNYDQHLAHFSQMLQRTNTSESPWHIVESNDRKFAVIKIYKIIISSVQKAAEKLMQTNKLVHAEPPKYTGKKFLHSVYIKNENDNENAEKQKRKKSSSQGTITEKEYRDKLELYQKNISALGHRMYIKRRPVVIVYEGWDAAGKGGNIKRLTEELDPRCYEVIPIGPPSQTELSHHYLWRFYNKIPKDGHFAIFDRSWYGRILVERVEQLTPVPVWQRAYQEINEMEAHMYHHGAIIFKFWMHIDRDEQLRRFRAREADPLKQHKITEDDWRNRSKWDLYEEAADEMILKTNTPFAPWTIIESNNKKTARIKVLETVAATLDNALR